MADLIEDLNLFPERRERVLVKLSEEHLHRNVLLPAAPFVHGSKCSYGGGQLISMRAFRMNSKKKKSGESFCLFVCKPSAIA
jgi:hypothetical protein